MTHLDGASWSATNSNNDDARIAETMNIFPIIPLNLILIIKVLTLDSLVVRYNWEHRQKFVPRIYLFICCFDMLMSIGYLGEYLILKLVDLDWVGNDVYFNVLPVVLVFISLANYMSIFANVILAVGRTMLIVSPHLVVNFNLNAVLVSISVYFSCWLIIGIVDIYTMLSGSGQGKWALFVRVATPLIFANDNTLYNGNSTTDALKFVLFGVPFLIPSLLVVACFIIQTRWVLTRPLSANPTSEAVDYRYLTITVLLITALFIFCQTTFTILVFMSFILSQIMSVELVDIFLSGALGHVVAATLPLLNASFTPVIIIVRNAGLQRQIKQMLPCKLGGGGGGEEGPGGSGEVTEKQDISEITEKHEMATISNDPLYANDPGDEKHAFVAT